MSTKVSPTNRDWSKLLKPKLEVGVYYKLRAIVDNPTLTSNDVDSECRVLFFTTTNPVTIDGICKRSGDLLSVIESDTKVFCIINCEWEVVGE